MRSEGIAAAERELKRAVRAHKRIRSPETHEDAEDAWADFLTHANKVYLKLRAACHGQGVDWMWWKKKMDERRDDPLLVYIHHARNSDTHRLEDTTRRIPPGSHVVRMPLGGSYTYVSAVPHLRPLPVIDQGIVYPAPMEHKGQPYGFGDVGFMAYAAMMHLQSLVAEAASRLR
jgi:hypothetical protein